MADQAIVTPNEEKSKIICCFIHYNKDDDLTQIFDIIRDFRSRYGLKFTHHRGFIFFTLKSEHLDELAKVRPFKVSKFITRSEYKCTKEVADTIISQRDSFIRMIWDEEQELLLFQSRTKVRIHNQLVQRIFEVSTQEFNKDNYFVQKDENEEPDNTDEIEKKTNKKIADAKSIPEGFTPVTYKKNKVKYNNKESTKSQPKVRGANKNV